LHSKKTPQIYLSVTGHRFLADPDAVKRDVQIALEEIEQRFAGISCKPAFTLLSPLAEGADQLVAECVLARPNARLIVPLPMDEEKYLAGFSSQQAKARFRELLKKAEKTIQLPPQPDQAHAFEAVGRFIVDNSDLLLAIWDGKQARGRGGTAEIVAYARKQGKPLCWIQTEKPGQIRFENMDEKMR